MTEEDHPDLALWIETIDCTAAALRRCVLRYVPSSASSTAQHGKLNQQAIVLGTLEITKATPAQRSNRLVKQTVLRTRHMPSRRLSPSLVSGSRLPSGKSSSRTRRVLASTVSLRVPFTPKTLNKCELIELRLGAGPSRATIPPPWRPSFATPLPKYRGGYFLLLPPHRYAGPFVADTSCPCGVRARRAHPLQQRQIKKKKRRNRNKSRPGRRCVLPADTPDPRFTSPTFCLTRFPCFPVRENKASFWETFCEVSRVSPFFILQLAGAPTSSHSLVLPLKTGGPSFWFR